MGGCRCSYKSCRSATKTTENLHFFHYPVKHRDRCAIWICNADKPEFANLPDYQLRNKVICGLHFEDKYFANIEKRRLVHNAVPSLDVGCDSSSDDLSYVKEVEILPSSNDGSTYTLNLEDIAPTAPKKIKIDYNGTAGNIINLPDISKVEPDVYTIDPSYFSQSFYNNDNIKEVVINSAAALADNIKDLKDDDEDLIDDDDCMVYDTINSSYNLQPSKSQNINIVKEDNLTFGNLASANEAKLQTLFFDHDDHEVHNKKVKILDSKDSIALQTHKVSTLKSANGKSTLIKKIKLAPNQTLTPISISKQPNAQGQIVKRTVFKRVTASTTPGASPGVVSTSTAIPLSPQAMAASLAGKFKQTQQIATNTIRLTNKNLLRCLKDRLPDSLLGAVSLHLNKRRNAVTVEEQEYETMITAMPLAGRAGLRTFGWCIPTHHT